jgi:antitoxin VapB
MALNIKDLATERLATEVAALTGETKTSAVRVALEERRARLQAATSQLSARERVRRFLENEAWPITAPDGPNPPMSKAEQERILGCGDEGV